MTKDKNTDKVTHPIIIQLDVSMPFGVTVEYKLGLDRTPV